MIQKSKKIGDYHLGDCIGKGAVGNVYRAINEKTKKFVAIKRVLIANMTEKQISSIHKEINLLKKLNHPNIVKYIDSISTEYHLNIVLEFADEGSLANNRKKFLFTESLVASFIKQVLKGLDYLHSQAVIHRDIKGANILLTKEGVVKLADFGVATKLNEAEKSKSIVGTYYWMAPEIIGMNGNVTSACDIWSVACTTLELLTGQPPYYKLNQMCAVVKIVNEPMPPLPENISDNLQDFLTRCFQKEPLLRSSAKELLDHPWIKSSDDEVGPEYLVGEKKISSEIGEELSDHIMENEEIDISYKYGEEKKDLSTRKNTVQHKNIKNIEKMKKDTAVLETKTSFSRKRNIENEIKEIKLLGDEKSRNRVNEISKISRSNEPNWNRDKNSTGSAFAYNSSQDIHGSRNLCYNKHSIKKQISQSQQTAKLARKRLIPKYVKNNKSDNNPHKQLSSNTHSSDPPIPKSKSHEYPNRPNNNDWVPAEKIREERREEEDEDMNNDDNPEEEVDESNNGTLQKNIPQLSYVSKIPSPSKTPTARLLQDRKNNSSLDDKRFVPDESEISEYREAYKRNAPFYQIYRKEKSMEQMELTPSKNLAPHLIDNLIQPIRKLDSPQYYFGRYEEEDHREFQELNVVDLDMQENEPVNIHPMTTSIISKNPELEMPLNKLLQIYTSLQENDCEKLSRQIVPLVTRIIEVIGENESLIAFVVNEFRFPRIIKMIEETTSDNIAHCLLRLVNQLIKENAKYLEQACLCGILPSIIKYGNPQNTKDLRVESAYFIVQICQHSKTALLMLVSSGGVEVIVNFLDLNYRENEVLIIIGIDCLNHLKDYNILPVSDIMAILMNHGAIERLAYVVHSFIMLLQEPIQLQYRDAEQSFTTHSKYLEMTLDLLYYFSFGNQEIKLKLASNEILPLLMSLIHSFSIANLLRFIRILQNLASEPFLPNRLENFGVVGLVVKVLAFAMQLQNSDDQEELILEVLKTLNFLCRLSASRCEQASLCGVIPCLIKLLSVSSIFKKEIIPLLCFFVETSKVTRDILWSYGGVNIYLKLLDYVEEYGNPQILDAIEVWLHYETEKVQEYLIHPSNIQLIIQILCRSKYCYPHILSILNRMTNACPELGLHLGENECFMRELMKVLKIKDNKLAQSHLIVREALEIVLNICSQHQNPVRFMQKYQLYNSILLPIYKYSQQNNIVILEQILSFLITLYTTSSKI